MPEKRCSFLMNLGKCETVQNLTDDICGTHLLLLEVIMLSMCVGTAHLDQLLMQLCQFHLLLHKLLQ